MPELPVIRLLKYDFTASPPSYHITFYHNGIKSGNQYQFDRGINIFIRKAQNNKNRSDGGLS